MVVMCFRNMAAALMSETVWYEKWRCDDAEREYYTRLTGGVTQASGGAVTSAPQVHIQSVQTPGVSLGSAGQIWSRAFFVVFMGKSGWILGFFMTKGCKDKIHAQKQFCKYCMYKIIINLKTVKLLL